MADQTTTPSVTAERIQEIRAVLTNEVIRAIASLSRQQQVCREQDGEAVFVTSMEAAREYAVELLRDLLTALSAQGQGWQPIESWQDNGEPAVVWNGVQQFIGYYEEHDGWSTDVDGDLLRIFPPPTHVYALPPAPGDGKE